MVKAIFRLYLPPLDEEFRINIKKYVQISRFFLFSLAKNIIFKSFRQM